MAITLKNLNVLDFLYGHKNIPLGIDGNPVAFPCAQLVSVQYWKLILDCTIQTTHSCCLIADFRKLIHGSNLLFSGFD